MNSPEENVSSLRDAGLRITHPRTLVLNVLTAAQHISAEDVYKALLEQGDTISLGTVYRVLADMEQAGLVERQNFQGTHAVYELKKHKHHDHLVCMDCGKVLEFVDQMIEEKQIEIAAAYGMEIVSHTLNLYGRCVDSECENRQDGVAKAS